RRTRPPREDDTGVIREAQPAIAVTDCANRRLSLSNNSGVDRRGKTTPELFERLNLRLAQSVTARNALGISEKESAQEIATMLYGEVHPHGYFRFVNFGHPPPLVFSAEYRKFMEIDKEIGRAHV